MNRPIFRLWNVIAQEFTNPREFSVTSDGKVLLWTPTWIPVGPEIEKFFILDRYLGEDCKDQNGVELCENDIILSNGEFYQIKYIEGAFVAFNPNKKWWRELPDWTRYRLVNNIYQNPELWK